MPRNDFRISQLNPGFPYNIPAEKLASINSLNSSLKTHDAIDYLMSNNQDFCVILTQYDVQPNFFEKLKSKQIRSQQGFEKPEKLIAGTIEKPLFSINSWESENTVSNGFENYFSIRESSCVNPNEILKGKNPRYFLSYDSWYHYESLNEPPHWKYSDHFNCTNMSDAEMHEGMMARHRSQWNQCHNFEVCADRIMKKGSIIGRGMIVPFELKVSHYKRKEVRKVEKSHNHYEVFESISCYYDGTYNMEGWVFTKDSPDALKYRIRAVSDFPTAENNYVEVQPENALDKKPWEQAGICDVLFVILDGNLEQPVGPYSILGSIIMQSGSNKMVIKFPEDADQEERMCLFSFSLYFENFMRSKSYRWNHSGECCTIL